MKPQTSPIYGPKKLRGSYASLVHNSLGGILFAIGCLSEAIGKWEK